MIQEYLFTDLSQYETVKAYEVEGVKSEFLKIDGTESFIAIYSVSGKNEDSARQLSQVDEYIVKTFSPIVLTNGSSAYFNKVLFPYINAFERKLRKLIYLKSAIHKSDKSFENINNLEEKDLGVIFECLFTDEQFVKNVRTKINSTSWPFTKREVLDLIQGMSENTVWDKLMGKGIVSKLSKEYLKVKDYRNDVMHAHNIRFKEFRESKELFEEINEQLDFEISKIITNVDKEKEEATKTNFNEVLGDALKIVDIQPSIYEPFNTPISSAGILDIQELNKELRIYQPTILPEIAKIKSDINALKGCYTILDEVKSTLNSPVIKEMKENIELIDSVKKTLGNK